MNNLSKREVDFIYLLLGESEYQPISYYAKKLNVSTKTLQSDLKNIRNYMKRYEIKIDARPGRGLLTCAKKENSEKLLNEISLKIPKAGDESSTERRELILKDMLLKTNEMTSIQKLSDLYYVGKTSIVNDMKYIGEWIQKYNLTFKKTKEGTCINGSETDIRKAIAGIAIRENTRNGLLELFGKEDIDFIEKLLSDIGKKNLDIGDIYYANLLTHILICIKRVRENIHIDDNEESRMIHVHTLEQYGKAKEIAGKINEHYNIQIGEAETYYIYQYLISSGFEGSGVKEGRERGNDDKCTEFASKLTKRLSEKFGIRFEQDTDMMQGLILHIRPMLNRLEYNIQIQNLLKEEIGRQYPQMVAQCGEVLKELAKEYGLPEISSDEVVNIAIYYQTMLEKKAMRKRVLVVCHSGYGTSQLLAAKLKNEFAFIQIADVVSGRKVKDMDITGIDYIIATVPIERDDVPYIIVSSLLSEQDIKAIRNSFMNREQNEGE